MKITLKATKTKDSIKVLCSGIALFGAGTAGVFGLSKNGRDWLDRHGTELIIVKGKYGEYHMNEVTSEPVP